MTPCILEEGLSVTPCILQEGLIMLTILLLLGSAAAVVLVSAKPGQNSFINLFNYPFIRMKQSEGTQNVSRDRGGDLDVF